MAPRTFWAILIKILGIYVVLASVSAIPVTLINIGLIFAPVGQTNGLFSANFNTYLVETGYFSIIIVIYYLIFRYCIFKTDLVIDKLRLDEGYEDERFEFNIHYSTIMKLAIIIIGGLLLIDSIPLFINYLMSYFRQSKNYDKFTDSNEAKYIITYLIKIFIGYFMLTCSRMIVNFIELKRRKPVEDMEDED